MADSTDKNKWLNRTVLGVGLTSLFSDWSHETATTFLTAIGARPDRLGAIEHGTGVTNYGIPSGNTRQIDGTADVNGQSGFFYRVIVADGDELGANDSFSLEVWGSGYSYSTGGNLGGGDPTSQALSVGLATLGGGFRSSAK